MAAEHPLDGIRVIDFTSTVAGPWCTRLLADCGAEVIKVEPVGSADVLRYAPPVNDGMGRVYSHFNCGKKGISLNLKSAEGIAIARRLIDVADIVVENFRPGVMQRLGLDYDTVSATNSRLIYCAISGFGQTGPMSGEPAYAPVVHAASGFEHTLTQAQSDPDAPLNSNIMIADVVSATYAFSAIQTAMLRRERFGIGAFVDVTLMESMMSLMAIQYQEAQADPPLSSRIFRPVQTTDGHITVPLVSMRAYFSLYEVIGHPEWKTDERFSDMPGIIRHGGEVEKALRVWALDKTSIECKRLLSDAGVPCAIYQTPAEVLKNDHLQQRGAFAELTDANGKFVVLNPPFQFNDTRCEAGDFVARQGEHTDDVLRRLLGVGSDELNRLHDNKSVA